jgi:hypothetical protein
MSSSRSPRDAHRDFATLAIRIRLTLGARHKAWGMGVRKTREESGNLVLIVLEPRPHGRFKVEYFMLLGRILILLVLEHSKDGSMSEGVFEEKRFRPRTLIPRL